MTEHSHSSSSLRRQPKQQRGKERVEKILDAVAVFDEVGYEAATTHLVAAKAECVHSSNVVMLSALRSPDQQHRQQLIEQGEDLLVSYLEPYAGDNLLSHVMKVMKCPHCQSEQLSKNGYRRRKQCYRCKDWGNSLWRILGDQCES